MSELTGLQHRPGARVDPARSPVSLRRRLLAWYRRHARDLPWRRDADPYRVWVSEVMLQQTRVATATPFYQTFLERFPTVAALAAARDGEVLRAWAGLGYYRRARHLHEAARVVMRDHAGVIPRDPERFGRLPGVGRYTTGAVLSIAFDQPLPVLDGNVARVLSRWFALDASVRDPRGSRRLWDLAAALVPMRRPGEWNQALMELGARICTPASPDCPGCPVQAGCRAHAEGRVAELPPVAPRRAAEAVRRAVVRIERGGRILMVQRTGALLAGLWEPPGVELGASADAARALAAELARLGIRARLVRTGETVKHVITHRSITVEVWRGALEGAPRRSQVTCWVDAARPRVAITALARRLGAGMQSRIGTATKGERMAEPKTKPTNASVAQFLEKTAGDRLDDCKALVRMMKKVTGKEPRMWGPSIVGFGTYRYVYASGREGDWPVAGFSPRRSDLTIYIMPGFEGLDAQRAKLGKHRMGKVCLYVKRLADIDTKVLERMIVDSVKQVKKMYG